MFFVLTSRLSKHLPIQEPAESTQTTQHAATPSWQTSLHPPNAQSKQVENLVKTVRRKLTVKRREMSDTFGDLAGTGAFVVLVGADTQKFTLRSEGFINRSVFFREARSKAWNKDLRLYSDAPIILANDCPHIFTDYLKFSYFGDVPEAPNSTGPGVQGPFIRMIRLYVLAEKLGDSRTANKMSDEIYTHCRDYEALPEEDAINQAYRSTKPDSLLRALLRDLIIYEGTDKDWYSEQLNEFDTEFCDDVLVEVLDVKFACDEVATVYDAYSPDVLKARIMDCTLHHHDNDSDSNPKCLRSDATTMGQVVADRRHVFR